MKPVHSIATAAFVALSTLMAACSGQSDDGAESGAGAIVTPREQTEAQDEQRLDAIRVRLEQASPSDYQTVMPWNLGETIERLRREVATVAADPNVTALALDVRPRATYVFVAHSTACSTRGSNACSQSIYVYDTSASNERFLRRLGVCESTPSSRAVTCKSIYRGVTMP